MVEILCAGETLQLLPEKAAFWRREKMLILADVHFGKPAAFRQAGIAVPESTTADDLARLDALLQKTRAERLAILGDLFHAKTGQQPEMLGTISQWRHDHSEVEIILIAGNHDRRSGSPPADWNLREPGDRLRRGPFLFSHDPNTLGEGYLLAGHVHPAIVLRETFGGSLRAPCFCFGPRRAILPAFGSFTGMHNLRREPGDRIFAVNSRENEIVELTAATRRS